MNARAVTGGLALYRTSYCSCGCRMVRLHADSEDGQPLMVIQLKAEQAMALARELVEDAESAVPGIIQAEARTAH